MDSFKLKIESDPEYLKAVRYLAKCYKISFEEMLERERKSFTNQADHQADSQAQVSLEQAAKQKIRAECVYFCYQEVGNDVYKHTNGVMIHGWYRIVKTDTSYEFTLMDTDLEHESWQKAIKEKHVTRFPLDIRMGTGSFKDVTPDKIYMS